MDLKQLTIGGVIGVVAAGIPLFTFFESRAATRERQAVRQEVLRETVAGLEARFTEWNRAITTGAEERHKDLEGRIWTVEQTAVKLREEAAFQRGARSQGN